MPETIVILLVTQFLAMMSPGPDMILILKNTVGHSDLKPATYTILGIGLGLSIHISFSIGGLAILLLQSEKLYQGVRFAGAAYLAFIGIKSLIGTRKQNYIPLAKSNLDHNATTAFRDGLITNLLNPKVTLFIISLFTQLISPGTALWQKFIYAVVLVVEALVVWLLFARAINSTKIKEWISNYSGWVDRLFGLLLLGIACSVLLID